MLVTCWTKLTWLRVEMALGVLLDVCCVREARQASHTVCKSFSPASFTKKVQHLKHAAQFTKALEQHREKYQDL